MHILNKPKPYKLPYNIQRRLESEQSQSTSKLPSIPNVYLQSRSKRSKSTLSNNDITISFIRGVNEGKHRLAIRRALATKITFQHNQNGQAKILPEKFIKQLKQPIKAIPYSHNKFRHLFDIVREIFGTDFQLMQKDILAAEGSVTQSCYIFFTSALYQPFSLCCKTIIHLSISDNEANPRNRYLKKENSREDLSSETSAQSKNTAVLTKFVCSGCYQTVFTIQMKSPQFVKESAILGKQTMLLEQARQKISMSIIVSSGKFKSMRIDKASQKEISLDQGKGIARYNPEDANLRKKSKTLVLSSIGSRQIL